MTDRDLGLTNQAWTCQRLDELVDTAQWVYHATKILDWLKRMPDIEPVP